MITPEFKYQVLKLFRKMKDGDVFTPKPDHENFDKFIEACKELVEENPMLGFRRSFSITFNNAMTKIKRNDFPRPSIWESYFRESEEKKRLRAEHCKNSYPYKFVSSHEWYYMKKPK